MSKQRAQVFIATTQGLVQVQSILALTEPGLQSVVTIDSSSTIAGISHAYQNFVAKPQGIVSDLFSNKAYRLNISSEIDQGESWQLGVFLAHYLFEHGCFSAHAPTNNKIADDSSDTDIIFIVTGRVDTLHYRVMQIDELAKKCLHANPNIVKWQSNNRRICFLAPSQNFRQPVPNTILKLSPIAHLSELFQLCKLYDLDIQEIRFPESIDAHKEHHIDTIYDSKDYDESVIIEAKLIDVEKEKQHSNMHKPINVDQPLGRERAFSTHQLIGRIPILLYLTLLAALTYAVVAWTGFFNTNEQASQTGKTNSAIEYVMLGEISQNRSSCGSAGNIELNKGFFALDSHSAATNLDNLCRFFVVTDRQVKSMWLVSDSKAIIDLNGVEINLHTFKDDGLFAINRLMEKQETLMQWEVPLPKNREQTRNFTLLAFVQAPDEADFSSLDSYLHQLHQYGESHDMSNLRRWINKTQLNNQVYLVAQEFTIYR